MIFHKCNFIFITLQTGYWYKDEKITNCEFCPMWWYYKCKCGKWKINIGRSQICGEFPDNIRNKKYHKKQNKWLLKEFHPKHGIIRVVHESTTK